MKPDALGRQDHVHTYAILKLKLNYIAIYLSPKPVYNITNINHT